MPVIRNDMGEKVKEEHSDIVWSRIDAVVSLMLENERYLQSKRNSELALTVMKQFDISERQAFRYISEAKKEIRKIGRADKEKAFLKAIRDREFLLQKVKGTKDKSGKLTEKPDYKLALEIMKDRDKLNGLYVEEVKHSGTIALKNIDVSKLTDDQLRSLKQKIKNNEPVEEYLKLIGLL